MLLFQGDAFEVSPVLKDKYEAFRIRNSNSQAFFSIDCSDSLRGIFVPSERAIIKIRNFFLAPSEEDAMSYFVKSADCRLAVKEEFSKIQVSSSYVRMLTDSSYLNLNEGIYQLARFRALFLDMLVLHASAVVYNDEVILFSGVSGAGKSTQARLWIENTDAWVLNYDKPIIEFDGEDVRVSGSPWGGKEDLAINEVRPVKALFFVHQARENCVVRLSAAQAYAQAHLNYFVYPLNQGIEMRYHEAVLRLVKKVPVYDLYCTDTPEAVHAVRKELYPEEE